MGCSSCDQKRVSWLGKWADCGCGCNGRKQEQKFLISLMSALVFFIIANPDTFRLVRGLLGNWVSSPTGCPTISGLTLHTLVFMLVVWGMMNVKSEEYEMQPSIGPSPQEDVDEIEVEAPPKMVDVPSPLPGFAEDQYSFIDTGLKLGSLDVTESSERMEVDAPAEIRSAVPEDGEQGVSCSCTDGRTVTINA